MVKGGIYNSWEAPGLQLRALKKLKLRLRLQLRDLIKASASLRLRNLRLRTHVCFWANIDFSIADMFPLEN